MNKSKPTKLGRWHLWWLKQFYRQYKQDLIEGRRAPGGTVISGWEGTVQGKALAGLLNRGLIEYRTSFEGGLVALLPTAEGLAIIEGEAEYEELVLHMARDTTIYGTCCISIDASGGVEIIDPCDVYLSEKENE